MNYITQSLKLPPYLKAQIQKQADEEFEGNFSLMARHIFREYFLNKLSEKHEN